MFFQHKENVPSLAYVLKVILEPMRNYDILAFLFNWLLFVKIE